jgi:hypothetical protein
MQKLSKSGEQIGLAHLWLASLDEPRNRDLEVKAQFNPKEIQIDRAVPWTKHGGPSPKQSDSGKISLEFGGQDSRSTTIELLFDSVEGHPRDKDERTVEQYVAALEVLARVRDPASKEPKMRRPHRCVLVWGQKHLRMCCVIESLSIKYTMFDRDGTPLRATCTVKLKEADAISTDDDGRGKYYGKR